MANIAVGLVVLGALAIAGIFLYSIYFNAGLLGLVVFAALIAVAYGIGRVVNSR
jgi:hypothetical protein